MDLYSEVAEGLHTMINKPCHAQGVQFLVKELHTLKAQVINVTGKIN